MDEVGKYVPFSHPRWSGEGNEARQVGICQMCKWRRGPWTCAAYPQGIPDRVLAGLLDHRLPIPGDGGIQFEAK